MLDIDKPEKVRAVDQEGMLDHILALPDQIDRAWHEALRVEIPETYWNVKAVVFCGMGGSAIGGDLASALAQDTSPVPILVHRDYGVPSFVGEETLVVASSYSGNTEETLTAFEEALRRKAKVLAMGSGGLLQDRSHASGIPFFHFDYEGQPRAALGYSFMGALGVLHRLGFVTVDEADLSKAVDLMKRLSCDVALEVVAEKNRAKSLALSFYGNFTILYAADIMAPVARRWKTQINENAKAWAFVEPLPEVHHNSVVGYENPYELAGNVVIAMLRSSFNKERNRLRYDVTEKVMKRTGLVYHLVDAEGNTPLQQMLWMLYLGDFVSFYMAAAYETDPTPVEVIDFLKGELARVPPGSAKP